MFGMFRVVKYYLAVKKSWQRVFAIFNSQMAIICPGGKLNNFKFQILLSTGDAIDILLNFKNLGNNYLKMVIFE